LPAFYLAKCNGVFTYGNAYFKEILQDVIGIAFRHLQVKAVFDKNIATALLAIVYWRIQPS
jgi:hypothetical protein